MPIEVFTGLLAAAGGSAEAFAVNQYRGGIAPVAAVFRAAAREGDDHAFLHCGDRPAGSLQRVGASHLTAPVHQSAGAFILHVDPEPDVRIGPFHLRDNTGEADLFRPIKLCVE